MTALNTLVNGSSGTCREAAAWLGSLAAESGEAADCAIEARGTAEATWAGPAAEHFQDETVNLDTHSRHLSDAARDSERALTTFADALDVVDDKMDEALGKATAGGLRIDGPFILAPAPPAAPAPLPTGPCGTAQAQQIMQQNQQAQAAFRAGPLAEYNAQVAVYNECKAIVDAARKLEENAHLELREAMGRTNAAADEPVNYLFTTVSNAHAYLGSAENPRRLAQAQADRLRVQADFLNRYALGTVASATPLQQRILERSAKLSNDGGKAKLRAEQFNKFVGIVPENARTALSSYPGKAAAEDLAKHSKSIKVPPAAGSVLRGMPYVGAGYIAFNEAYDAWKGEQSWARAGADTGAVIAGGALGSAAVGAGLGMTFGLPGAVVGGFVGGLAGTEFAQDVVEGIFNVVEGE